MWKAPENWFKTIPAGNGITQIVEQRIKEDYRANIWFVEGRDFDMIVDTGFGIERLREKLDFLFSKPVLAVATHSHCDHIGGHFEFDRRAIHAAEAHILAHPTNENTVADGYVGTDMFVHDDDGVDFDPDRFDIHGAAPTQLLRDGDTIDLGDRAFEVIHVPGHSPGGIVLWDRVSGVMFSGDMVHAGPNGIGRWAFYHSDLADMRKSVERLLTIPVTRVYPGHYGSFGANKYRSILEQYADRDRDPTFPLLMNV